MKFRTYDKNAVKARVLGRSAALFDLSISAESFRLYCVLDDFAGVNGEAWPRLPQLLVMTGFCRRKLFYALAELKERGHVTIRKDKRRAIYALKWVHSGAPIGQNRCTELTEQVHNGALIDPSILYEPVLIEPVCEICEDNGWTKNPSYGGRVPCDCEMGQAIKARLSRSERKRA